MERRREIGKNNKFKSNFRKDKTETTKRTISIDVRLNKYIANCGICSRREADELIAKGEIKVNNKVVTELGYKIRKNDIVKYKGKVIKVQNLVYILLNKPKDYVTTLKDPHAKKTVFDIIKHACDERVYPVGRLDKHTTGLLLFTNDGELAKKLTHPSYNKKKIYMAGLDKPLDETDIAKLGQGIELEDGYIKPDAISYVDPMDKTQIGIELHSGKNRIVRRIFEYAGYNVIKLDRVYFAGLTKKGLPRGKWRFLDKKEISILKMGSYQ